MSKLLHAVALAGVIVIYRLYVPGVPPGGYAKTVSAGYATANWVIETK